MAASLYPRQRTSSPTLTNPDLILPYGPSLSPEPPSEYSPPAALRHASRLSRPSYEVQPVTFDFFLPASSPSSSMARIPRPLSDIAEVAGETPHPAPKKPATAYKGQALTSSPTLEHSADLPWTQTAAGRLSDGSSSSVHSDQLASNKWPGFAADDGGDLDDNGHLQHNVHAHAVGRGDDNGQDADADDDEDDDEEKFDFFPGDAASNGDADSDDDDQWLGPRADDGSDSADSHGQDALSRQADLILANAKKRLNMMEGNLRGARTSLMGPASSMTRPYSAMGSSSTSSLRDRERFTPRLGLAVRTRQFSPSPLGSHGAPGHSRIASETDLQPSAASAPAVRPPIPLKRSSSALGGFVDMSYSSIERSALLRGVKSQDGIRDQRVHTWVFDMDRSGDRPLLQALANSQTLNRSQTPPSDDAEQAETPGSHAVQRPPSTAGSLQAQMQELKGKISNLKEKAREEQIKRQSLNSIRTPSPFTAAEIWYQGAEAYRAPALSTDAGIGWSPAQSPVQQKAPQSPDLAQERQLMDETPTRHSKRISGPQPVLPTPSEKAETQYEDAEEESEVSVAKAVEPTAGLGLSVGTLDLGQIRKDGFEEDEGSHEDDEEEDEDEEDLDDEEDDNYDDSDNSVGLARHLDDNTAKRESATLRPDDLVDEGYDEQSIDGESEYFEAPTVAERHEDRADAFDYEHFFLHSAMGSFSRTDRRGSVSSQESVETTRPASPPLSFEEEATAGATAGSPTSPPGLHRRSKSMDSISTMATFKTATEGKGSDSGSEDGQFALDAVTQQLLSSHGAAPELPANGALRRLDSGVHVAAGQQRKDSTAAEQPSTATATATASSSPPPSIDDMVRALIGQPAPGASPTAGGLLDADRELVAGAMESLRRACRSLQAADAYGRREWRRRMDTARRALEGEEDFSTMS